MLLFQTLALLASLASFTLAGNAIVRNNCTNTIYAYRHDSNSNTPTVALTPSSSYSWPLSGSTVAIRVGVSSGLPNPMEFDFTNSNDGNNYYALSTRLGNPFQSQGFSLTPAAGSNCHVIHCPPGANPCQDTYYPNSNNNPVWACNSNYDLQLNPCSG